MFPFVPNPVNLLSFAWDGAPLRRLAVLAVAALGLIAMPAGAQDASPAVPKEDPAVKIINFTADWCPNCQALNPRLDAALARFSPAEIRLVNLDLTATETGDDAIRQAAFRDAVATADANKVAYLWDWYGGVTGLAVFVSADNGEPLSCANRSLSTDEIERRLREALVLSLRAPAGARKPNGPDCPPPVR